MKLRFSVGSAAIVESVIVVAMPLCDDEITRTVGAGNFDAGELHRSLLQLEVHAQFSAERHGDVVRVSRGESDASDANRVWAADLESPERSRRRSSGSSRRWRAGWRGS